MYLCFLFLLGITRSSFTSAGSCSIDHTPAWNPTLSQPISWTWRQSGDQIPYIPNPIFIPLQMDRNNPACIKRKEADDVDTNCYDTEKVFIFSSFLSCNALAPLRLWIWIFESPDWYPQRHKRKAVGYFRSGLYNPLFSCQTPIPENLEKTSSTSAVGGFCWPIWA